MKYEIKINDYKVLLDIEDVVELVNIVTKGTYIESKYVGTSLKHSSNYVDLLRPVDVREMCSVRLMTDELFGAMQLSTKLYLENQDAK